MLTKRYPLKCQTSTLVSTFNITDIANMADIAYIAEVYLSLNTQVNARVLVKTSQVHELRWEKAPNSNVDKLEGVIASLQSSSCLKKVLKIGHLRSSDFITFRKNPGHEIHLSVPRTVQFLNTSRVIYNFWTHIVQFLNAYCTIFIHYMYSLHKYNF